MEARNTQPYFRAKLPGSNSRIQYRQTIIDWGGALLGGIDGEDEVFSNEHTQNLASSRIQLWFRTLMSSKRAALQWLSMNIAGSAVDNKPLKALINTLFILGVSEGKISYFLKQSIAAMKIKQIHGILDEVVEEALIRCMRFEAAQRCIMNDSLQYQNQTPDRGERRSAMDNSFISPSSSSTSSYVSGGLKSMAAMAGGLKSMVADSVSGGGPSTSVRNGASSERLVASSETGSGSPQTPASKKTLSKKLFSMMTGGMMEKDKQKDKSKEISGNRESIDEASV